MGRKVLVIGSGGREHALVWKLAQSPEMAKLYAAPGNPGIAQLAECVDIKADDIAALLDFARQAQIDLTVVGPENPLINGIVDAFDREGLLVFGPSAAAAELEGSKVFTKQLLRQYNIPTADYKVFDELENARTYVRQFIDKGQPVVVKVDGLAAGKGVVVASTWAEADEALRQALVDQAFGLAGKQIVIEECLQGEEVSVFVLCDGSEVRYVIAAQDHKRVGDGDLGPNTGGMGAYVNPPIYTPELHKTVMETIIIPTVKAMAAVGRPYKGVLYAGLMITESGPKVLEYNARWGDPETQVIMPMLKSDLLPLLYAVAQGNLSDCQVELEMGTCVGVVLASEGYPGNYSIGRAISGLDQVEPDIMLFHAGTAKTNNELVTNGGRVIAVVARGNNLALALDSVYQAVDQIDFTGMHYRKDIGAKALQQERR